MLQRLSSNLVRHGGLPLSKVIDGVTALSLRTKSAKVGTRVYVSRHSEGVNGGGGYYVASSKDGLADNGGTIIFSDTVAWVYEDAYGTVTLEHFGAIEGSDNTIAFRNAVNSPAQIVTTKLKEVILTDNCVFTRGNVQILMPDTTILWNAAEGHIPDRTGSSNASNYRFPGIIAFRGVLGSVIDSYTIQNQINKGATTFRCSNNALFQKRQWVIMSSDVGSGTIGREVNVMTQVQGSGGASTELRVDYKNGWPLSIGRVLTYRNVTPVEGIKVHLKGVKWNQNITDGAGSGDAFTSQQSCALLSLEYVNDAEIILGEGKDHPYPMVVAYYPRNVTVRDTTTNFPRVPGSDHVVQFNNAYECHALRLRNISGRHVVDFSGGSYCSVRFCGETGTRNGAFTTHGIFEHNLVFENNYGLLSFANSGEYYGSSCDMVTVKHHFGDYLIAQAKVTNLHVEHAIFTRRAVINNDAVMLVDVTVNANTSEDDKGLRFVQSSSVYGRGATIVGGDVILSVESGRALPSALTQPVVFDKVYVRNFNGAYLGGADVKFLSCSLRGSSSGPVNIVQATRLSVEGGMVSGTSFAVNTTNENVINVHGASFVGQHSSGSYFLLSKSEVGSAPTLFLFKDNNAILPSGVSLFKMNQSQGSLRVHSSGNTLQGGTIDMQTNLPSGSYVYHKGNVERNVTRNNFPADSLAVSTSDNLTL